MSRLPFRVAGAFCGVLLLTAAWAQCAEEKVDEAALLAEKARELTAGATSRVERVLSLQVFVRDEIKEAKTQYG
jgi:hypothetical protein